MASPARPRKRKNASPHPDYRPILLREIQDMLYRGIEGEWREALKFFERKINESLDKEP